MFVTLIAVLTDEFASGTEVYQLEFDTEEAFRDWKDSADVVNMKKLTAE